MIVSFMLKDRKIFSYGRNDFAVSKNLSRYRSENNFIWIVKKIRT